MAVSYYISIYEEDHPLILQAKEKGTVGIKDTFFKVEPILTSNLKESVRKFMDIILEVPVRVGGRVFIISSDETILEEHIIIQTLQRRFLDTVAIVICRNDKQVEVPYLPELRKRKDVLNTDHVGCGSCSGNCSSCG